jgi:GTPase SAR1 family protein
MGAAAAKLRLLASKKRTTRLLMIGLDAAGKSTILYKLKLGEVSGVAATAGYECDATRAKKGGPSRNVFRLAARMAVSGRGRVVRRTSCRRSACFACFFFQKKTVSLPLVCHSPLRGGQVVQSIPTIGKQRVENGLLGHEETIWSISVG